MIKKNIIFIFAYYSFKDPVFQSAVLPYLKAVQDKRLNYVLLTWEQRQFTLSKSEVKELENDLKKYQIIWKRTLWHSGHFKLIKKVYDFFYGLFYSLYLIREYKITKIFSEGFPGAIIGHYLSKISRKPHIIHTFEPHADYMLESGVWKKSSWEYKFLKRMEFPIAQGAQHIITGTGAYKKILVQEGVKSNIHVIPSCIDLESYHYDEKARNQIRTNLKIGSEDIVIVYLGKIGGMYMEDELFRFFKHSLSLGCIKIRFFLFTDFPQKELLNKLKQFDIPTDKVYSRYLRKEEVNKYLSASDIGFCGIRPIPSRRYSSPIKNGEYWACGLPTLIPKGISDDYIIAVEEGIGISFNQIEEIKTQDVLRLYSLSRTKIMETALKERGVSTFKNEFERIFNN